MWKVVLTIFSLFWIRIQLTYLEADSTYAWVFLIGDAILGLSLFIITWYQEIENIEKRGNKNEKGKF
jgi:hypothetical protein|nr:MAG TPA: hypothetical protein [Caudoviricetes sp.]